MSERPWKIEIEHQGIRGKRENITIVSSRGIVARVGDTSMPGAMEDAEVIVNAVNAQKPSLPEVARPIIVCLCGSTRFWRLFQRAGLQETMAGRIVLSIGAASGTDDEHFGNLPRDEYDRVKEMLDQLHMRKIDLCDEVLILNQDGYIGESTAREMAYAQALGKRVRYWSEENDPPTPRADLPAWLLSLPDAPQQRAAAERALVIEQERPSDWIRGIANEGRP